MLEAIAGHTASQTRAGMNTANVEAYTSMLTGMVGTKLPGMDVASSAALLARMNASISGGGSAGEAGQNFLYSALGGRGMDPMDVTVLREQGLFGTGRRTFGAGSAYSRYASKYGLGTPDAANDDSTNFERIQRQFEKAYGGGPQARKLMANAMANLYGINNSQAMAIATVNPAQLGGMGRRLDRLGIDVKDVNATGISRMAQIEGDSSLSESDKDKRMRQAATEGQEQTQGSIARDSKAALENIKSTLADRLVPAMEGARAGIMYLAGGKGAMSSRQIQEAMMTADSDDRKRGIKADFEQQIKDEASRPSAIRAQRDAALAELKRDYADPEKRAAGQAKVQALSDQLARQEEASRKRVLQLQDEREKAIGEETAALQKNIKAMNEQEAARRKGTEEVKSLGQVASGAGSKPTAQQLEQMVGGGSPAGAVNARAQEAMQFFMSKGYSREQAAGLVANLARESSTFDPRAVGDSGKARGIAQWHPDRQADFKAWSGKDIGVASFQEQLGFVDYELTKGKKGKVGALLKQTTSAREAAALVSRRYEIPANADREAALRGAMAENYYRTPLPDTGAEGRPGEQRVVVEMAPGEFVLKDQRGQQLAQTQVQAAGRVAKPQPAGM
ncbi:hypothetical protein ACVILL_006059 [Bradyrhizobium sp. USDA 3364]